MILPDVKILSYIQHPYFHTKFNTLISRFTDIIFCDTIYTQTKLSLKLFNRLNNKESKIKYVVYPPCENIDILPTKSQNEERRVLILLGSSHNAQIMKILNIIEKTNAKLNKNLHNQFSQTIYTIVCKDHNILNNVRKKFGYQNSTNIELITLSQIYEILSKSHILLCTNTNFAKFTHFIQCFVFCIKLY